MRPDPAGSSELEREGRVLTRYLIGRDPDGYILRKYADGHGAMPGTGNPADGLDRVLLATAVRGPVLARIADAYARIFRPRGTLRRKLILLVAVLENAPATHRSFTAGADGRRAAALLRIAGALGAFALALGAGLILFGPRHLAGGSARRGAAA